MITDLTCHLSKLRLATSRLARKQTNFLAAQKILLDQLDMLAPGREEIEVSRMLCPFLSE